MTTSDGEECTEVQFNSDDQRYYVCRATRYTEHTHAELTGYMEPIPNDAPVALDDNDCLFLVEVNGCLNE